MEARRAGGTTAPARRPTEEGEEREEREEAGETGEARPTEETMPRVQPNPIGIDAYAPKDIAVRVEGIGVTKATMAAGPLFALAVLAGVFIAFGGLFFTVVITGSELGLGPTRLLGGVAFSLGLILVVVGGAELFTGNNLIVMAWCDDRITTAALLRNWGIVLVGNAVGAVATAFAVHHAGVGGIGDGALDRTVAAIAAAKVALPWDEAFLRGVLCNALVCLAVWLSVAARTVVGKILAIVFPIAGFVAAGLEHSIANMYLIPVGMLAAGTVDVAAVLGNLLPVTLGNVVGGSAFVALFYYWIYVRGASQTASPASSDQGDG